MKVKCQLKIISLIPKNFLNSLLKEKEFEFGWVMRNQS